MAVIKVKRPNGEEHTFNLTDNSKDTGGNYIRVRFNEQDLYARVSGDWTPLNIVKPNGDRGYVQHDAIAFTTWRWESKNVESFNRWYVYLPKGRYHVYMEGRNGVNRDLVISDSKNIEITVTTSGRDYSRHITFNIDNQIVEKLLIGENSNKLFIERTGNI